MKVTTSALRHYEAWGIVPPPERKPNGYRLYTELHVAYFECIRAMAPGFGMDLVKRIMPFIQQGKFTDALWLVNEAQAKLHEERRRAEQALRALEMNLPDLLFPGKESKWFTIGEAAAAVGVPETTLRHWEKEGLVVPDRQPENRYRRYSRSDLQRLLIVRTLRVSGYSLESIREIMRQFDANDIAHARKIARDSLSKLDYMICEQLRGCSYLHKLFTMAGYERMGC